MAKYWYRVDVLEGSKTRGLVGTSELAPSQLAERLKNDDYLVLGDLSYRDNQNRIVPLSEWEPRLENVIYINPRHVITVMPFAGDPRSAQ